LTTHLLKNAEILWQGVLVYNRVHKGTKTRQINSGYYVGLTSDYVQVHT